MIHFGSRFAGNSARLAELVTLFLDDIDVEKGDLASRLVAASKRVELPTGLRDAFQAAASADSFTELPRDQSVWNGMSQSIPLRVEPEQRREPAQTSDTPGFEFEWSPPDDDIETLQRALVRFERSLAAFIRYRLIQVHGDAWLRRGCGAHRVKWQRIAETTNAEVSPETLLGFAEFSDYKDIILNKANWRIFAGDFRDPNVVKTNFAIIEPYRNSSYHAAERTVYAAEHPALFTAMIRLAQRYNPPTADAIDALFAEATLVGGAPDEKVTVFALSEKNFSSLPEVRVVGRENEIRGIQRFWEDPFTRVLSITGHGGVGKTALAQAFLRQLLEVECLPGTQPHPEVSIYFTAKDNWLEWIDELEGKQHPTEAQRLTSLRSVLRTILVTCGDNDQLDDLSDDALRLRALTMLDNGPQCLLVLDNLEALEEQELSNISEFLQELPGPSKAVVTDRIDRGVGRKIPLRGLPYPEAVRMMKERLREQGIELDASADEGLASIAEETDGVPLLLMYCVSGIAAGLDPGQAINRLRGVQTLELLRFAFDSSIQSLTPNGRVGLALACHLKHPLRRNDLTAVLPDSMDTDTVIRELIQRSFLEPLQDGGRAAFRVTSKQLREHVVYMAHDLVPAAALAKMRQRAAIAPSLSFQPNVEIAVQREIDAATQARDWAESAQRLEQAIATLGPHPRLTAKLGWIRFRQHRRTESKDLLRQSISAGDQDVATFRTLSLVYFYEGDMDSALSAIESAIRLGPSDVRSQQILGEVLLHQVERSRLMLDASSKERILARSRTALGASLIAEDRREWERAHNSRTLQLLERLEAQSEQASSSLR